jgi:type VI secretion system secreted protein Hcp
MFKRLLSVGLCAGLFFGTPSADAALSAYLKIKAQKQGDIKGGVVQKGREGSIEVDSSAHEITVPRDATSGAATGRRQHKPFTVVVEVDRALPLLYNALVSNENLSSVELKYFRSGDKGGGDAQFFTVKLTNATIVSIRFSQPNSKSAEQARLGETAEISFTYQKIEWTWNDGGIRAQDDVSGAPR